MARKRQAEKSKQADELDQVKGDPRRAKPERLKTVIRHPVVKAEA